MTAPLFSVAVLALNVVVAELLARHTKLRHLGTALLVIITMAICANLGLIPTVTEGSPVHDALFDPIAHLAIFLLLLQVKLAEVHAERFTEVGGVQRQLGSSAKNSRNGSASMPS